MKFGYWYRVIVVKQTKQLKTR